MFGSTLSAQSIKGRVVDSKYQPIAQVYVFTKELGSTVITDKDGAFDIFSDSTGIYTLSFAHPSYVEEYRMIEMPSAGNIIQLTKKTDESSEAIKSSTDNIIKNAIALAPLYQNAILTYKAEATIKGYMRLIKISPILKSISQKDDLEPDIREGDIFMQESINDISFEKNKYLQKSKMISNTFPKDFDLNIPLANYNIYDLDNYMISPLSSEALNYYDFTYEKSFIENANSIVHQIKVSPKKSIDRTFAGYIYISNNDFHVTKLELININSGVKTSFRQIYTKLDDNIWVVSNNNLDFEVSILGNQVEANYASKISYKNYVVNHETQKELQAFDFSSLPSNPNSYKISQESSFWEITPSTSSRIEQTNIKNKYVDNFQKITTQTKISIKDRPLSLGLLIGDTYKIDSTLTIGYGGLVNPTNIGYNLVDGWTFKQTFDISKKIEEKYIQSGITTQYSFDRKLFMFDLDTRFIYQPSMHGIISLKGGIFSADFNNSTGINSFENGISALFFRENYINFYENRYFNLSHSIDLSDELTWFVGANYHSRIQLNNIRNYSVFYKSSRQFQTNTPIQNPLIERSLYGTEDLLLSDYKASIITFRLLYIPNKYYSKSNDMLKGTSSNFPDITFMYRKGLKNIFNSISDFDHLELSFKQQIKLAPLKSFQYLFCVGYFPNNRSVHFSDFKHFNIKESKFMLSSFDQSYNLLEVYQPSTDRWYISSFNRLSTDRFLLKNFPLLESTSIQENIFFSYLITPYYTNYAELGYSLSNIGIFTSIGTFMGFNNLSYTGIGFKVSFNITNTINSMY